MNIETIKKLGAINKELKVGKNKKHNFLNFSYRSLEDILRALNPLLEKYEAIVYTSEHVELLGNEKYLICEATFATGEGEIKNKSMVQMSPLMKGANNKPPRLNPEQQSGCAISYVRRYTLGGLFCIDDSVDSDSTSSEEPHTFSNNGKNGYTHTVEASTPPKLSHYDKVLEVIKLKEFDRAHIGIKKGFEAKQLTPEEADELTGLLQDAQSPVEHMKELHTNPTKDEEEAHLKEFKNKMEEAA